MNFHVRTMGVHMTSGLSMCHEPQYGPWWQYIPWISTEPSSTAWTLETIMSLNCSTGHGHEGGLWGNMGHRHQHVPCGSMVHGRQRGFKCGTDYGLMLGLWW